MVLQRIGRVMRSYVLVALVVAIALQDASASPVGSILPTAIPTKAPSPGVINFTDTPIGQPSAHPSASPTLAPNTVPSSQPTKTPTATPTAAQAIAPSSQPTSTPAATPTLAQFSSPSSQPTSTPTATPTLVQSIAPSSQPTSAPTATPTLAQVIAPSSQPTSTPTATPTLGRVIAPSSQPTSTPTATPTLAQVVAPSSRPTSTPTATPATTPTAVQVIAPSSPPTATPTATPTAVQAIAPSSQPTSTPTATPTTAPSRLPATSPSSSPTVSPSVAPTLSPSRAPTFAAGAPTPHSHKPSQGPTAAPSSFRARSPSTSSTSPLPGTKPTATPTSSPTTLQSIPSSSPTQSPTTKVPSGDKTNNDNDNTTAPREISTLDEFCAQYTNKFACKEYSSCDWDDEEGFCIGAPDPAASWALPLAMVLAGLGILTSIGGFGFVYRFRKRPAVQLSQPLFLFLFLLGCAFLNGAVLMYTPDPLTPVLCIAQRWMFDLSFTITFATQFLKLWRVWRVFSSAVMTRVRITNTNLLQGLVGICGLEVLFLGIWTVLEPPIAVDPITGRCEVGSARFAIGMVSYAYIGVLFLFAVIVSFKTRDLGDTVGDSRQSFLIVHNTLLLIVFNVIFSNVGMTRSTEVVLLAASVFYGTAAAVAIIVHVKWDKMHESHDAILHQATEKQRTKSTRNIHMKGNNIGMPDLSGSGPQDSSGGGSTPAGLHGSGSGAGHSFLVPRSDSFNSSTNNNNTAGSADVDAAGKSPTALFRIDDEPRLFLRELHRERRAAQASSNSVGSNNNSEVENGERPLSQGDEEDPSLAPAMSDEHSPPVAPSLRVRTQGVLASSEPSGFAGMGAGLGPRRHSSLHEEEDDDDDFSQRSESPQWNKSALVSAMEAEEESADADLAEGGGELSHT